MGMRINNNIAAMNSYRNLSVTDGQMTKSLEKLSSGFRINRAADDAAGLAISEGLRSQIGGLKVANRNTQDGISVVQTAEGALTESHAILQRMRDLAVQSANDSNDANSRSAINSEATSLKAELTRIADKTTYNNIALLDGSFQDKNIQVGYAANDVIKVSADSGGAAAAATAATFTATAALTAAEADAVTSVTAGSVTVDTTAATTQATLVSTLNGNATFAAAYTASEDANGKLVITSDTTGEGTFSVTGVTGSTVAGTDATLAGSFNAVGLGVDSVDLSTAAGATTAIGSLDTAIQNVSKARGDLGALQNRFEHTINNLSVTQENLTASESRIRDTDMAQEMMQFTRSQILSQAGTSMLAQANQMPQGVLSLLR